MSQQIRICYDKLDSEITKFKQSALLVNDLGYLSTSSQISKSDKEYILSYYLMQYFIQWENFLEDIFCKYMCGYSSTSGNQLLPIGARYRRLSDAHNALLGRNPFLNWIIKNSIDRAEKIFGTGNIISQEITNFQSQISGINTVRNASAHQSQSSTTNFIALVRNELGAVPRGITPGKFLFLTESSSGKKYIEYYAELLITLGNSISSH